jgi:hypothetical protein
MMAMVQRRHAADPINLSIRKKKRATNNPSMNRIYTAVALVLLHSTFANAFQSAPWSSRLPVGKPSFARHHRRPATRLIRNVAADGSFIDGNSSDDDDDGFYDNVELSESDVQVGNMQDMLTNLIDISATPDIFTKDDSAPPPPPIRKPTTNQLEQLVSQLEAVIVDNEGPEALEKMKESNDDDAPYLDASAYANYRNSVNEDGSLTPAGGLPMDFPSTGSVNGSNDQTTRQHLKALVNPQPEIPDSYYTSKGEATMEDLFSTQQRQPDEVDEDLHNQIMAQEVGFQKQSELFQGYLQKGDEASGEAAAYMLREQRRRKEQEEMLLKLEREMNDLDETLAKNDDPSQPNSSKQLSLKMCPKCKCPLTQVEIESGQGDGMCQVCYGDLIAQTSDMRFLDAPPVEYTPFTKLSYRQSPSPSSSSYSRPTRRIETPVPSRRATSGPARQKQDSGSDQAVPKSDAKSASAEKKPAGGNPPSQSKTVNREDGEVAQLKRQIVAFQQQVQKYRQQAEVAETKAQEVEQENLRLLQAVAELQDKLESAAKPPEGSEGVVVEAPWMEVIDPDTGDVFYWNEDTEEMRWDMD